MTANIDRWAQLLSHERLHAARSRGHAAHDEETGRSEFDADYGRLIFSSAFRRLQDKTQVFPLAKSDYTRTRLTHTLEVANVGRGLGKHFGLLLQKRGELPGHLHPEDVATIVSVACLAHDIGNPPFGHSGEAAIQEWAQRHESTLHAQMSAVEFGDLRRFEGNAQSFRILARLWARQREGGARLTLASYGALLKYPRGSGHERDKTDCAGKKFNYFQADATLAEAVRVGLGLSERRGAGCFARHPLVYLMEAADDICYRVVDLEDSEEAGVISRERFDELLRPFLPDYLRRMSTAELRERSTSELRAHAIGALMAAVMHVATAHLDELREGTFTLALIDAIDPEMHASYEALGDEVRKTAYIDSRVLQVEFAGFKVIGGLLDELMQALPPSLESNERLSSSGQKLLKLLPKKYLLVRPDADFHAFAKDADAEAIVRELTPYERTLVMTDYVSGMTDSYALDMHRILTGVKLP
ncbi:dGTP triphosphohydrolase [Deinococcus sp. Marseille-Q6407]|uniref:dGTP triphosphohydrolase n=1 Tax=Deinococcus sp. Marseille-Q6407 TaxID=2969223 RepID=UPI0021BFF599|nr:dNTP triphosphohydrolase [Deinococcus sp. Marseille-Q6407]